MLKQHSGTAAHRCQGSDDSEYQIRLRQQLAWICEYDDSGEPWADYICAARYKAVYGTWPDGTPHPLPVLSGLSEGQIKWLLGQSNPSKWARESRPQRVLSRAVIVHSKATVPSDPASAATPPVHVDLCLGPIMELETDPATETEASLRARRLHRKRFSFALSKCAPDVPDPLPAVNQTSPETPLGSQLAGRRRMRGVA